MYPAQRLLPPGQGHLVRRNRRALADRRPPRSERSREQRRTVGPGQANQVEVKGLTMSRTVPGSISARGGRLPTAPRAFGETGMGAGEPRTRKLTILAQDPSVRVHGRALTAELAVPLEKLSAGPLGYRVHVIDYDATTDRLFAPADQVDKDRYADVTDVNALVE